MLCTFMYTTHIRIGSMCTYSTVQAAPCNRDIGKVIRNAS